MSGRVVTAVSLDCTVFYIKSGLIDGLLEILPSLAQTQRPARGSYSCTYADTAPIQFADPVSTTAVQCSDRARVGCNLGRTANVAAVCQPSMGQRSPRDRRDARRAAQTDREFA